MGGALSSSTSQVSLPQAEEAFSPSRGVAMPRKGLAGMQEKRRNQVGGRGREWGGQCYSGFEVPELEAVVINFLL